MDSKTTIHNKLFDLEDSMVVYVIYNAETLEQLINSVHNIHNTTTLNEEIICWTVRYINISILTHR